MQELAAKRGGKCLSEEYINNCTKLEFQCSEDISGKTEPASIINNKWCPTCRHKTVNEKRKDNIVIYQNIAIERGGKCLSEEYINCETKISLNVKMDTNGKQVLLM